MFPPYPSSAGAGLAESPLPDPPGPLDFDDGISVLATFGQFPRLLVRGEYLRWKKVPPSAGTGALCKCIWRLGRMLKLITVSTFRPILPPRHAIPEALGKGGIPKVGRPPPAANPEHAGIRSRVLAIREK